MTISRDRARVTFVSRDSQSLQLLVVSKSRLDDGTCNDPGHGPGHDTSQNFRLYEMTPAQIWQGSLP